MANAKTLFIEQIEQIVAPVIEEHAAELVDLQYSHEHGQWVLRFFLDKEGGIKLDDCATISDHLGRILDATDIMKQHYSLEVSSPGLNRPLKKEADYLKFMGERVEITMYAPLNGRRNFKGTLQSLNAGIVSIQEETPQHLVALPLADIAKARLDPEIHF